MTESRSRSGFALTFWINDSDPFSCARAPIPAVEADWCPACGESVLSLAESTRTSQAMLEFNKQVNASLVDPGYIGAVRRKLKLDQREAAELFGGGVNAFSRYETGKTKPPLALVQLLRLLDRHPDLLEEVREAS